MACTHVWSLSQCCSPTVGCLAILAHHIVQRAQADLDIRIDDTFIAVLLSSKIEEHVRDVLMARPWVASLLHRFPCRPCSGMFRVHNSKKLM